MPLGSTPEQNTMQDSFNLTLYIPALETRIIFAVNKAAQGFNYFYFSPP